MFVDSHCHLIFPELHTRLDAILADMAQAKVLGALCISTTLEECPDVVALARAHANLWASVGVHPDTEGLAEPDVATLVALANDDKVIAIGETGLDYYRLNGRSVADMEWQRDRLRVHVQAARETRLPLIIHTRSSSDDTLRVLKEQGAEEVGGVFHCFTETREVARAALDMGFYISLSGILTFKNAEDLRDVARMVPLDRLLIETDSPYLAPVPYRGKTNSPAWVPHVAAEIARVKGLAIEEVAAATTRNFEHLFAVSVPH
ncbi:MAG: DNAase [Burkholderiales bacterium PBB6]|nr:MAG: DNAase [Burkholderiales bacterium PBB6]